MRHYISEHELYQSLTYKTFTGHFIHLSELTDIFTKAPDTEAATAFVLKYKDELGVALENELLWYTAFAGEVGVIHITDAYNARNVGINTSEHYYSHQGPNQAEIIMWRIVEQWSAVHYSKFTEFFGDT